MTLTFDATHRQSIWLSTIVLVALIVRLVHIDFPVAGFQAWRQADTASMARNYYEHGFHFAYPEIDWGGGGPVECEFPIYQFIVSLLYVVFSPIDMVGRIVSVAFSLLTIVGLYRIVRLVTNERLALISAGVYAILPLNIFYGRAFMPESTMLLCSVWGIYFFAKWIRTQDLTSFLLATCCLAMAALVKIVALYLGLPILFIAWTKYGFRLFRQRRLWLMAFGVMAAVSFWYYHAHQIFLQTGLTFSIWKFGTDKWGIWQPLATFKWYNDIFFKSIGENGSVQASEPGI